MKCFSNEANSLVKDCKELLASIPNQDSYEYPTELLSLQGTKKIFQIHYDPESTQDNQGFILDTCWDDAPLLITNVASVAESSINTMPTGTPVAETSKPKTEMEGTTITPMNTPSKPSTANPETPDTFEPEETDTTPPPKQTPTVGTSQAKTQTPKRSARKILFTEDKDAPEKPSVKKSKKGE